MGSLGSARRSGSGFLGLLLEVGFAYCALIGVVFCGTLTARHWYPDVVNLSVGDWWQAVWPFCFAAALIAAGLRGWAKR